MNLEQLQPPLSPYDKLTDVSRAINRILGDDTGRSVTVRVGDGVFNATNGQIDLTGEETHAIMGLGLGMLVSRNRDLQVVGSCIAFGLVLAWHAGKREPARLAIQQRGASKGRKVRVQLSALR